MGQGGFIHINAQDTHSGQDTAIRDDESQVPPFQIRPTASNECKGDRPEPDLRRRPGPGQPCSRCAICGDRQNNGDDRKADPCSHGTKQHPPATWLRRQQNGFALGKTLLHPRVVRITHQMKPVQPRRHRNEARRYQAGCGSSRRNQDRSQQRTHFRCRSRHTRRESPVQT